MRKKDHPSSQAAAQARINAGMRQFRPLPSYEILRRLSQRGRVAFAVRAAQRVQPLYRVADRRLASAVGEAIEIAQRFASGHRVDAGLAAELACAAQLADSVEAVEHGTTCGAAHAAYAAACGVARPNRAAMAAAAASYAAETAAGRSAELTEALWLDFDCLLALSPRSPDGLGRPVDFTAMAPFRSLRGGIRW